MKKTITLIKENTDIVFYLLASVIACFFFSQIIDTFGEYVIFMAIFGTAEAIFFYLYERYMLKKDKKPSELVKIILIGIFILQILYVVVGEMIFCFFNADNIQWIFSGVLFVCIVGASIVIAKQYGKGKLSGEQTVAAAVFIAFLFHLLYAQFTGITNINRQNDTIAFTNGGGHLGYIWHVWAYGNLPQVDPRSMWEFSQPPLYYLLCGYWIKLSTLLGIPTIKAAENMQFISVLCVTLTTIYMDKIMVKMHLSPSKRVWGVACISLLPYFTYLSGAVNNDVLLLLFTVMSFYYAICWYQNPKLSTLVLNAVITGLLVMSKSSGALVAPAIAALFLMRFIKDKDMRGQRALQYLLYGAISLPIGLWWNIRNMIRFDMPFLYVNEPSTDSIQYIPDYTVWERLFGFRNQLNHLYTDLFNTSENVDYNIVIGTLKTLTFTHSSEMMQTSLTRTFGLILFIFTIMLVVLMVAFGLIGLIKGETEKHQKIAWSVLWISYILFYLKFNLDYPFVHTIHARYLLPIFVIGIPWMLVGMQWVWRHSLDKREKAKKFVKIIMGSWMVAYFGVLQCFICQLLVHARDYV